MKNFNKEIDSISIRRNDPNFNSTHNFKKSSQTESRRNLKRANSNVTLFNRKNDFINNLIIPINPNPLIKSILDKMVNVKKTNIRLSNDITSDRQSTTRKDKLIFEVKQEVKYLENQNSYLMQNYEKLNKLKEKCDTNQKEVTEYHRNLYEQFQTYKRTVRIDMIKGRKI